MKPLEASDDMGLHYLIRLKILIVFKIHGLVFQFWHQCFSAKLQECWALPLLPKVADLHLLPQSTCPLPSPPTLVRSRACQMSSGKPELAKDSRRCVSIVELLELGGALSPPHILPTSVPATMISSRICQYAGSATVLLKTLSRLPSALFTPSIDWAVPTGSNDFRVSGNTLYTTVGTTSRAYETWNHLGELFIQL